MPLVISDEQMDEALNVLEAGIQTAYESKRPMAQTV
jgi:4-aminobutyrate aminotransferase-like enzyme